MKPITRRIIVLGAIILSGIGSRLVSSGFVLFDNYLGDALYAAMLFMLLLVLAPRLTLAKAALISFGVVVLIELFQLTNIPLAMRSHENSLLRLIAIVLGTTFNGWDLVSYAIGILIFFGYEAYWARVEVAQ
ncbi:MULTISPECIES: DUF2809 domain-containing protein [Herpetosiphon]|nr:MULTISPECIES: DUF2809 domain-containing protein [Herpetosiphon]MBM7844917.1 hypothetical protein [Herpetosiphon giganteus]